MKSLEKILYVEDDIDIQAIAKIALENVGNFQVCSCSSGGEALEKIESFQPDVLLLDVMMPEMDGPTTLQKIRQIPDFSEIPVIFMTAKVQPQEVDTYISLGALGVISKPFDPMTLDGQIRAYWEAAE